MTREIIFRIILGVHLTSFLLSCVLGPLRGHRLLPSVLGGLALGPLNLILIFGLKPPARGPAGMENERAGRGKHL